MSSKALVVAGVLFNALLWSQSRYAVPPALSPSSADAAAWSSFESLQAGRPSLHAVLARAWHDATGNETDPLVSSEQTCRPLSFPVADQCKHVWKSCPPSDTFLSISYLQSYFCAPQSTRPLHFAGLLVWLIFLFSFIGITASDFFCPNLSTIAQLFGLSDNIAGVTFLAFGNGSPDLFSTYSAMRANSGSLAVGELLGAATFIISVVAGTLGIVKPFHVRRTPFLRDIGFFTVAVSLLFFSLYDGKLQSWEAALLIVLYVLYVVTVVVMSWWERRRRHKMEIEALARAEYARDDPTRYRDSVSSFQEGGSFVAGESRQSLTLPQHESRTRRSFSQPGRILSPNVSFSIRRLSQSQRLSRSSSRSSVAVNEIPEEIHRDSPERSPMLPSFSLLGALEFQSVVSALERESAAAGLGVFEHSSRRSSRTHGRSLSGSYAGEVDPWDAALARSEVPHAGSQVPLSPLNVPDLDRSPTPTPSITVSPPEGAAPGSIRTPLPRFPSEVLPVPQSAPAELRHALDSPASSLATAVARESSKSRWQQNLRASLRTLFPTLHNFWSEDKSWLGRITAVIAAPAVLLLTLSLPVVIIPDEESEAGEDPIKVPEGQLVDIRIETVSDDGEDDHTIPESSPLTPRAMFERRGETEEEREREGESDVSSIMSDVEREIHGDRFNKWLLAVQCLFGPTFVAAVLFSRNPFGWAIILATAVGGIAAGILVVFFAGSGKSVVSRITRALVGFAVAMVWIMAIADEVVRVLQTFGFVFGLSDAIVGLTVFAIGNSLADFVANLAVARFAPIMGFSACFGGPMLNMLLGVGISGSLVLKQNGQSYYPIEFSRTLFVSTIGLLTLLVTTMIFVPLNGYRMSRRWGIFLVVAYIAIMTTNVVVEIRRER